MSDVPVEPPADGAGPVAETIVSPARPDGNQWELVVIGDGYTSTDADAAKFDQDVSAFVAELQGTAPFGDLWDRIRNTTASGPSRTSAVRAWPLMTPTPDGRRCCGRRTSATGMARSSRGS